MKAVFQLFSEGHVGSKWQAEFLKRWSAYQHWYLQNGVNDLPTYKECASQVAQHMPELLSVYHDICELAGGDDLAARFLSMYKPPAYIRGCSQVIWPSEPPVLIRNYDFSPLLTDSLVYKSRWLEKEVICLTDCLIGAIDGINENGLAVSLAFGGRSEVGDGFGISLILRYILETCDTTRQAENVLKRIPSHMAYNVTVLDANGQFITAYLSPNKKAIIKRSVRFSVNHQPNEPLWEKYAQVSATQKRESSLKQILAQTDKPLTYIMDKFHKAPLYSNRFSKGFGTLYTAIYSSQYPSLTLTWPDKMLYLDFDNFKEQNQFIIYNDIEDSNPS